MKASGAKRAFHPPRKLTEAQEQEVTRLYAKTTAPVSEIAKQFKIGESSVYRVAQRHGASLRGKTGSAPRSKAAKAAASARGRSAKRTTTARMTTARKGVAKRRTTARASSATSTRLRATSAAKRNGTQKGSASSAHRFRVSYVIEKVVSASSASDALRKAATLGAKEVASVVKMA